MAHFVLNCFSSLGRVTRVAMGNERIEAVLKAELGRIDQKLREARNLHSAAWIGTGLALGVCLATLTSQIPIVIAMALAGAALNLAVGRISTRDK